MRVVSSAQNPLVKRVAILSEKARERKKEGVLVVEGLRELTLAVSAGYAVETVLWRPETTDAALLEDIFPAQPSDTDFVQVNAEVFAKIAYRSDVPNAVAVCRAKPHRLSDLVLPDTPLVLVVERVEKPGNLGAMLRTADAAGVDAVLVCDPLADPYNPNCIRASLGAVFGTPLAVCTAEEACQWLTEKGVRIMTTWLEASRPYHDCDLTGPVALVLGSEADGISPLWIEKGAERIIIPMYGRVDSLNVSNAAAIVLFEAVRQRRK